jgi:hypothetical protein
MEATIMSLEDRQRTLYISNPIAECGHCNFGQRLQGVWFIEDGRLVFRANANALPGRGPDLDGCYESDPVVQFDFVVVDQADITQEEIHQLRATADKGSPLW